MSVVYTVVANILVTDLRTFFKEVKRFLPDLMHEVHEEKKPDEIIPRINLWIDKKSLRYTEFAISQQNNSYIYTITIPILSNQYGWGIAFEIIDRLLMVANGRLYTEDMDPDEDEGMSPPEFEDWKSNFDFKTLLNRELKFIMDATQDGEVPVEIFGRGVIFSFGKHINEVIKSASNPFKKFEENLLQLILDMENDDVPKAAMARVSKKETANYNLVAFCNVGENGLIPGHKIAYFAFSRGEGEDVHLVPVKNIHNVIPADCFYDEYTFKFNKYCMEHWNEIVEKAIFYSEEIS